MARRSQVELLPDAIRQELERRLLDNAFSGYESLSAWLGEQGFEISKSAVHRFGQSFEERAKALRMATEQAKVLMEAAPDDESALGAALVRLTQEKCFAILLEAEIDPSKVNFPKLVQQIGQLTRADVYRNKHAAEIRREAVARAAEVAGQEAKSAGLSAETVEAIRKKVLGIAT